jgi:integrase
MFCNAKENAAAFLATVGFGNLANFGIIPMGQAVDGEIFVTGAFLFNREQMVVDVAGSMVEKLPATMLNLPPLPLVATSNESAPETQETRACGTAGATIAAFSEYLRNKGKAERTYNGYPGNVRRVFTKILELKSNELNDSDLEALDLSKIPHEWLKEAEYALYNHDKLSPTSFLRIKHGWNSFCSFIDMEEWKFTVKINSAEKLKTDPISNDAIIEILRICREKRQGSVTMKERIRLIRCEIAILLGWQLGLRSCEYKNAKFSEILYDDKITVKNSKHGGTRELGVSCEIAELVKELRALLESCEEYPPNGGIFEKSNGSVYSTSSFRRWLKNIADASIIDKDKAKTHGLRHRFARNFLDHSSNLFMLTTLMGHKSVDTTKGYTRPTFEEVRCVMLEANKKAWKSCTSNLPTVA